MKKKAAGKFVSLLAAGLMALSMIPTTALAAQPKAETVDQEWYNFRNNQENNGVTDRPTPTNDLEAAQKWAVKYGSGWSAAPTPPLILDNYLYIGVSNKVLKVDKETGEKVAESDAMAGNVGYAMNPILYADGKLFVQVGNGVIQALDYETLKCVWKTEAVGGQTISPISYTQVDGKGYIYTGTWSGESRDGTFFCISTDDEGVVDGVKETEWRFVPSGSTLENDPDVKYDPDLYETLNDEDSVAARGFYWAGAYATENYVAVGSDDGTREGDYTANGVFYTLNPTTGDIIDKISGIKGDIRTTTVYDNGHLYFSTKGGLLYKVDVDENGKLSNESCIDLGGMTTAAPLVYKNKIYIGVAGEGGQFDPDGGHSFAVVSNEGNLTEDSLMYELPIQGYPQAAALLSTANEDVDYDGDGKADGRVYIYFTYNATPGGIYYTYDTPDQKDAATESRELFVPAKEQQQYCISTICADRDGTLYYKNDSCYLMAVETNEAYLNDITLQDADGKEGSWDSAFDPRSSAYTVTMPSGTEKAKLHLDLIDGSIAVVNGENYTDNMEIALAEEETEIAISVSKGEDSRTYTLTVRRESAIATLSGLRVNNSNSASSGDQITLSPEFAAGTYDYVADITEFQGNTSSKFWNVWPTLTDEKSSIKVYPVENIKESKIEEDGTIERINPGRYAIYPADTEKTMKIRIEVTSENGEVTQDYNLTLLKKVDVASVSLSETEHTMYLDEEPLQLTATVLPEDASYKTVKWYSSDDEVVSVDENGLVTAKKAGTATITVITDDKSMNASCKLTVRDKNHPDGYIYMDVEKATIGQGYLIKPQKVPFWEGESLADVMPRFFDANNMEEKANESGYGYYLEAINDTTGSLTADFPAYIKDAAGSSLEDKRSDSWLGEFDYSSSSGWVFKADNVHSPVGASGVTLKDNMTVRWAFTVLGYGSDCWDTGYGDPYVPEDTNRDQMTRYIADFNALEEKDALLGNNTKMKELYETLIKAGTDYTYTQQEIDDTLNQVKLAQAAAEVDIQIAGLGDVTLESKEAIDAAKSAYNGLTAEQKGYVTKLDTLEAAEKTYAELKEAAEQEAADKAAAAAVDKKIEAIGEVSLESKAAIDEARSAYNGLTEEQKGYVTKLDTLEAAETVYAELVEEAEEQEATDKAAAAAVDKKIEAIGEVSLESKADIDIARTAYDGLTKEQKGYVTKLDTLEAAEAAYAELVEEAAEQEKVDKAAAAAVDKKIEAIGEVSLESKEAIDAAKIAYNGLTEEQKGYVTKLDTLEAAEKTYAELKEAAEQEAADKAAAAAVDKKIEAIGEVSLESKETIDEARSAYNGLTEEQKGYVTKLDILEAAEKTYAELKEAAKQEAADKAAAAAVDKKIEAIGEVSLESKEAIDEARSAYNGLT